MKPSGRVERDFDALAHYHKPTEQTGGSTGDGGRANGGPAFFPSNAGSSSQIQDPAHDVEIFIIAGGNFHIYIIAGLVTSLIL